MTIFLKIWHEITEQGWIRRKTNQPTNQPSKQTNKQTNPMKSSYTLTIFNISMFKLFSSVQLSIPAVSFFV